MGATVSQSEPGSNGNKGIFHIPKSSRTGVSLSAVLVSYLEHMLGVVLLLPDGAVGMFYSLNRYGDKNKYTWQKHHYIFCLYIEYCNLNFPFFINIGHIKEWTSFNRILRKTAEEYAKRKHKKSNK